jgi:hypothetical protein
MSLLHAPFSATGNRAQKFVAKIIFGHETLLTYVAELYSKVRFRKALSYTY